MKRCPFEQRVVAHTVEELYLFVELEYSLSYLKYTTTRPHETCLSDQTVSTIVFIRVINLLTVGLMEQICGQGMQFRFKIKGEFVINTTSINLYEGFLT
jgi:hypothetical protein